MSVTDVCYDNPTVIDLKDCTEVPYRDSGLWTGNGTAGKRCSTTTTCRESASALSVIGFVLLLATGALCAVSAVCPFWIYYPKRWAPADVSNLVIKYPFEHAIWRGLWAVCYKEPDLNPRITQSVTPSECVWFGGNNIAWKSIPS